MRMRSGVASRACTARTCTNVSALPRKPGVPNAAAALGWKPGLGGRIGRSSNEASPLPEGRPSLVGSRRSVVTWLVVVGAILMLPVAGYAQEATLSGTVTDATGAVLPGVAVRALHEASGNSFEAVTDERGAYRIPVRIGVYRVTAELTGFASVTRSGLELLVGQQAVVNLQMSPSAVQESVTVTGETPLIDVTQSSLAGNIDPRQVSELPVNGRNWLDLTMLAPGSRTNAVAETPLPVGRDRVAFQLNLDGQQVTNSVAGSNFGQPRFSKDAIAEFVFSTNRFDAAQGRSYGVVVSAVTKSGTNTPSGTFSGYFRDDRFNAADFIERRVLPYSNQQLSTTFGGPIRKDKVHFFANYEYEREPQTFTFNSPYRSFNIDLSGTRRQDTGGGRLDLQFTPRTRLAVRSTAYHQLLPVTNAGGATTHPSAASRTNRYSNQTYATLTQVLGTRTLNEIKGGYNGYHWTIDSQTGWQGGNFPGAPVRGGGSVRINLRGYAIGTPTNLPQAIGQHMVSIRDDLTYSFNKSGRHDLRVGAEYIRNLDYLNWCSFCNGAIDANNAAVPANIEQLFPVWNDASTWNLAPLSPIAVRYRQSIGRFDFDTPRQMYAGWAQDDWTISRRLTLNLGVRYDLDVGVMGERIAFLPWLSGHRPSDTNNIAPRLGFALSLNDLTVIRGGYGLFFTQLENDAAHQPKLNSLIVIPETPNDGRSGFAGDPYNGKPLTYDQAIATLCSTALTPTCVRRELTSEIPSPVHPTTYSHQASIGMQRQIGTTMSVEANYVYNGGRAEEIDRNMNINYNPATGVNYLSTDISRRPYPTWGAYVNGEFMEGRSNYHGLETAFTKRLAQRWQASATYTLSGQWDDNGPGTCQVAASPDGPVCTPLAFNLAPDLGGDYTLAATDQRHRAVFNGIWELGYGFQLSGLYFYGSGYRFATSWGGDLRNLGNAGAARLRTNGTIVPRNNLVGEPIHRVDMRIQRRFRIAGRAGVDGILEVFNLFNHENYGSYTTVEPNAQYGTPSFNNNVAYQPRILQLGFRSTF